MSGKIRAKRRKSSGNLWLDINHKIGYLKILNLSQNWFLYTDKLILFN